MANSSQTMPPDTFWGEPETVLRHLYRFLPQALRSVSGVAYAMFVNSLREQSHPTGIRDIREVEWEPSLSFKNDLGERYGCEFHYGYVQERFEVQLFREILSPGLIVFDVGANFGFYTVISAQVVAPSGRVYAFEPAESAFDLLKENVRLNDLGDIVVCHDWCIGAVDGQTTFYVTENSSFSSMRLTGRSRLDHTREVQVRSIDSFVQDVGLSRIDALKIDVEGFEYAVLSGAVETIRRSPEIVIMLEVSSKNLSPERKVNLASSLRSIFDLGFRAWVGDEDTDGMRVYDSCEDIVNLPSAELFLVATSSPREKQLLEAYARVNDSFKESTLANGSSSPVFSLGKGILNLLEESRAQTDTLSRKIERRDEEIRKRDEKIQKRDEEIRRRDEEIRRRDEEIRKLEGEIQRWRTAPFFSLLKYRYGPGVKRRFSVFFSRGMGGSRE